MLWTDTFTLAAGDTVRCFSAALDQTGIKILTPPVVRIPPERVDRAEDIRNTDLHRTSGGAVAARGTSDQGHAVHDGDDFLNDRFFLLGEWFEICEGSQIVFHLIFSGHTGKDRHHAGQGAYESKSP